MQHTWLKKYAYLHHVLHTNGTTMYMETQNDASRRHTMLQTLLSSSHQKQMFWPVRMGAVEWCLQGGMRCLRAWPSSTQWRKKPFAQSTSSAHDTLPTRNIWGRSVKTNRQPNLEPPPSLASSQSQWELSASALPVQASDAWCNYWECCHFLSL
jgi:hypothetical protein